VNVLAVVHGSDVPAGSFGDVVAERGHRLETWVPADAATPPPIDAYDAVMVFGGAMHVDQEAHHPWLREEEQYVRALLDRRVPLLGVCLGAQMVAKAAGARVGPADEPEIGWCDVDRKVDDPVLGILPARFPAFQWHFYAFDVPAGAAELARSRVCPQAFRLGERAWAVQFHPEVTREIVARWAGEAPDEVPGGAEALLTETEERIDEWTRLGRGLCGAFLEAAAS
jgi:GMP synthase-like glutamine amidotransferase